MLLLLLSVLSVCSVATPEFMRALQEEEESVGEEEESEGEEDESNIFIIGLLNPELNDPICSDRCFNNPGAADGYIMYRIGGLRNGRW